MRQKLWLGVILFLVLPGLLFTVSCARQQVQSDTTGTQQAQEEAAQEEAAQEERAQDQQDQDEMARQREMEAQQIAEEAAQREAMAARMLFENERIYFEFDSSALLAEAQEVLKRKAEFLRDNPNSRFTIEGHCDERGTEEYNLALGDRRAGSAKAFLVDLGIAPYRITTISYGEERPLDPRSSEEAWAKNRNCQFVLD
ncbi:Tol-Pal system peptidoglycan-associated lipoprotein PAL [Olavius algarvensis associated proteobacterium Delta 3]|nr:Tol-Pal system peptidoglycan-associated lipoprotein PAL [Olavius algarvensis associated proteobacterium Delta 3]